MTIRENGPAIMCWPGEAEEIIQVTAADRG